MGKKKEVAFAATFEGETGRIKAVPDNNSIIVLFCGRQSDQERLIPKSKITDIVPANKKADKKLQEIIKEVYQ